MGAESPQPDASNELVALERDVESRSAVFKKELGLFDLVLTQVVFVVGTIWVGWAAKLGSDHGVFWLLAIITFYLPLAAAVIFLNRLMPLEGGLYQWAKFAFLVVEDRMRVGFSGIGGLYRFYYHSHHHCRKSLLVCSQDNRRCNRLEWLRGGGFSLRQPAEQEAGGRSRRQEAAASFG